MIRLGLLIVAVSLITGCSTSRKVVVQDGYRGITQTPSGFEPKRPGALTLAPAASTDARTEGATASASRP